MLKGTVKFFNAAKGFGFISPDEGGKDVFLPAQTVVSAGLSELNKGQRVSFTAKPEGKGPKAISLTLISHSDPEESASERVLFPSTSEPEPTVTFYHDPHCDASSRALARLRAAGHRPRIVEYLTSPPTKEDLKRLSALLNRNGKSLVRRYDRTFLELRLDDRFMSEGEFWDAILEHPALINGPIIATVTDAAVCESETSVDRFLSAMSSNGNADQMVAKPKALSERALRMLAGDLQPSPLVNAKVVSVVKPLGTDVQVEPKNLFVASETARNAKEKSASEKPNTRSVKKAHTSLQRSGMETASRS